MTGEHNLVSILESSDYVQLSLAKGLLEDAGIPVFVEGDLTRLYQSLNGLLYKLIRLSVPYDREVEARDLLAMLMRPILVPKNKDAPPYK